MAVNDDAVRVAVTGSVYCAPIGTTLPTDATTTLNAAFQDVGYITVDGTTETLDVSTEKLPMWQAPMGVRTLITDLNWNFQFQMGETSPLTQELFYVGAESATVGGVTTVSIPKTPVNVSKVWVVQFVDGDVTYRIVLPKGDVTDRGEVGRKGTEGTVYDITVSAMATTLDDLGYIITNDPEMVVAAS